MSKKQIEAEIKTATGTVITLRGASDEVSSVVGLFAGGSATGHTQTTTATPAAPRPRLSSLDGIAETDEEGNVHIIVSDLKAKNALDAAKRLIYITLFARRTLLQEQRTARAVLNQVLTGYGLYDGNVRRLISRDKALVKQTKNISLSTAATPQVQEYITQIKDASTKGKWTPGASRKRRRAKSKNAQK
jgi:hypothetical protein